MRRILPLLALLAGCPKHVDPGALDPTLARYVLVQPDAALYRSPDDSAPAHPWRDPDRVTARAARGDGWSVWRLVHSDRTWSEVESLPSDGAFCKPPWRPLHGLKLKLWVKTARLGAITTREVGRHSSNGTGYTLSPGLPVVSDGQGGVRVRLDDIDLSLKKAPPRTGTVFEAAPPLAPGKGPLVHPLRTTPLPVAGSRVTFGDASPPISLEAHLDDGLVRLATRCATFDVRGVDESRSGLAGLSTPATEPPPRPARHLRQGAPVYWPDGTLAGTVAGAAVPLPPEVAGVGDHRCFDLDLIPWRPEDEVPGPDQFLRLCLAPGDVVADEI